MFRSIAIVFVWAVLAPPALAQGAGIGPDNGADLQSMSAASAAAAKGHARTVMSGHGGMSHATMERIKREHRQAPSNSPN